MTTVPGVTSVELTTREKATGRHSIADNQKQKTMSATFLIKLTIMMMMTVGRLTTNPVAESETRELSIPPNECSPPKTF